MKQRLGVASEKASLVTRSKICVVVLIATVLIETVFIACSVLGSDTSPRSVNANSTSNTSALPVGVTITSPIPPDDDAADFMRQYEVDCEALSISMTTLGVLCPNDCDGQTQSPVTVSVVTHRHGTDSSPKTDAQPHKSTCPCVPHTLGKWVTGTSRD